MATLTPLEEKFLKEHIPNALHQRYFKETSTDNREIIMNTQWHNGDLTRFLESHDGEKARVLAEKKKLLSTPVATTNAEVKEISIAPQAAENDMFVQKLFLRHIATHIYGLKFPTALPKYDEVVSAISKFHHDAEAFEKQLFSVIGIGGDEASQHKIRYQAFNMLFGTLFSIVSCKDSGNSQHDAAARMIAIYYQRKLFGYESIDDDQKIAQRLNLQRAIVIKETAKNYAELIGEPIFEIEKVVEQNFEPVIRKLGNIVLSVH